MTIAPEAAEEAVDLDWLDDWSFGNARARSYGNGFFSLKYDDESETCVCPDRASWPTPDRFNGRFSLPDTSIVDVYDEDGNWSHYELVKLR